MKKKIKYNGIEVSLNTPVNKKGILIISCFILVLLSISIGVVMPKGKYANEKDAKAMEAKSEALKNITNEDGERILGVDLKDRKIEFENHGVLCLSQDFRLYKKEKNTEKEIDKSNLHIGVMDFKAYKNKKGEVNKIVLNSDGEFKRIRVALRKDVNEPSKKELLYYNTADFKCGEKIKLLVKSEKKSKEIKEGEELNIKAEKGELIVGIKNGKEVLRTKNRLYLCPLKGKSEIQVITLTRGYKGNYFHPTYKGTLDLKLISDNKFVIVNELPLEEYLCRVVPSEIPSSYGKEAIKTQAVLSRTLAIHDYLKNRYSAMGCWVDDSTMCQVYNNIKEDENTREAVYETEGVVIKTKDDELALAEFYDCSGGFGACPTDVWFTPNEKPQDKSTYLVSKSYTYDPKNKDKVISLKELNENKIKSIYKDLSLKGYDDEGDFFRWKIILSKKELQNTINKNLILTYKRDSNSVLTKNKNGEFIKSPISLDGVGDIRNMYVSKRGESGNVMELIIEGTKRTVKICKEFNIRFTIRPRREDTMYNDVKLYRAVGGSKNYDESLTRKNYSILPSAFFTFDIERDNASGIRNVIFYGGGNGHGVGIPQEGMKAFSKRGYNYKKIIETYLSEVNIEKMS